MQKEFKVRVHTCVVCVRVCGHRLCPFRTEARGERNRAAMVWCGPGLLHTTYICSLSLVVGFRGQWAGW